MTREETAVPAAGGGGGAGVPAGGSGSPVPEPARLAALDAARGFALLGIFIVNIGVFAMPLAEAMDFQAREGASTLDLIAHYFTVVFCTGKFYPLFSLLFGIGLALQTDRLRAARGRAWPVYLRRLGVLCVLGLLHALLLWYGDILFIYSIVGFVALPASRLRAPVLFGLAGAALALAVTLGIGLGALALLSERDPGADAAPSAAEGGRVVEPVPSESDAVAAEEGVGAGAAVAPGDAAGEADGQVERGAFAFFLKELFAGRVEGPEDPVWRAAEIEAFRDGPFRDAVLMRALSWLGGLAFALLGFGWHVLAMFLLGMGLLKAGAFERERLGWHRVFVVAGAVVGLPCAIGVAVLPSVLSGAMVDLLTVPLMYGAGVLMPLGYLGAWTLVTASGRLVLLTGALMRAGRMALTVYLSQTLIATFLMYHWGLGWFGTMTEAPLLGLVLVIYPVLVLFAVAWLRVFRMGPMEWVWRSLTYLRAQPLRR